MVDHVAKVCITAMNTTFRTHQSRRRPGPFVADLQLRESEAPLDDRSAADTALGIMPLPDRVHMR